MPCNGDIPSSLSISCTQCEAHYRSKSRERRDSNSIAFNSLTLPLKKTLGSIYYRPSLTILGRLKQFESQSGWWARTPFLVNQQSIGHMDFDKNKKYTLDIRIRL